MWSAWDAKQGKRYMPSKAYQNCPSKLSAQVNACAVVHVTRVGYRSSTLLCGILGGSQAPQDNSVCSKANATQESYNHNSSLGSSLSSNNCKYINTHQEQQNGVYSHEKWTQRIRLLLMDRQVSKLQTLKRWTNRQINWLFHSKHANTKIIQGLFNHV